MTGPIVAACQTVVDDGDVDANLDRLADRVAALPTAVKVAVFPEYSLSEFVPDRIGTCALARDDAIGRVHEIARRADCALVVGFVERADDAFYNATAYVRPEDAGRIVVYRKRHLWSGERAVLSPGDDRVVVETPAGPTGLLTCYDLNFVEESAALARRDVRALFVPGAWPTAHVENWRLLLRARALDGVRWVVGAGRTGRGSTTYAGNSAVVSPDGRVLTSLGREEADCLATLDPSVFAHHRGIVFPNGASIDGKRETKF
ncbi:carbon-nitrogen hydrolase family protein [Halalkalicoccus sp. NIPERK01]|uniref:carbon-nitrogen hydrolase family protein n=1 Tax=Halalkalicoccus sp. NIPERK01 TaxID=3053469 RepID=UPI00256EDB27|nr:carbon-nitrogen hydrolase family protein [Halalkalicoccus sp. NIPERK01]MDL5360793.1 carbon-nitrogen hydrolase family protein [Halalkalicoccus sp. NIPERK01]